MIVSIDDRPDVVAVIATLGNKPDRLRSCLEALLASESNARLGVVCILNSPRADVEVDADDRVTVVRAGVNLGWAGAINFARSLVETDYLWLVQDDMVVAPDALEQLLERLRADPGLGAVGPVTVTADGIVPAGTHGGVYSEDGVILRPVPPEDTALADLGREEPASYLPSRGLLTSTAVWDRAGGMSTALYPVQYVDVDFSRRLAALGLAFAIVPTATAQHERGGSTPPAFARFLQSRNGETSLRRWFPDGQPFVDRYFPVSEHRPDPPGYPVAPVDPRIPPEVLHDVMRASTEALMHLGKVLGDQLLAGESAIREQFEALEFLTATNRRLEPEAKRLSREVRSLGDERDASNAERLRLSREVADLGDERDAAKAAVRTLTTSERTLRRKLLRVQEQLVALQETHAQAELELAELRTALESADATVEAMRQSTSWRITSPLRFIRVRRQGADQP